MSKPKRRIKAAKISLISLVPAGANRVTALFKGRGDVELSAVAKIDVEGYLTALVYVPDMVDSQQDVANAQAIKQMAHDFISNMEGNGIDVLHDCQPIGSERARICETFLVQKGDPRFAGVTDDTGAAVDPTGAWGVVIKIDDPDLRALYASGEWVGVSMFGSAIVEPVTKSAPKETQMDATQMAELLKTFGKSLSQELVEGLAKALAPAPVTPTPATAPAVEFEGDPFNPDDVAKHAERVLFASLDLSKAADLAKWQAHLAKRAAPAPDSNAAKIDELEKQLAKLRKAPTNGAEPNGRPESLTVAQKLAKAKERAVALKKEGVIR